MSGNNFHDLLFASMDSIPLPKLVLLFNPLTLRTAKTSKSYGHSECKGLRKGFIPRGGKLFLYKVAPHCGGKHVEFRRRLKVSNLY